MASETSDNLVNHSLIYINIPNKSPLEKVYLYITDNPNDYEVICNKEHIPYSYPPTIFDSQISYSLSDIYKKYDLSETVFINLKDNSIIYDDLLQYLS